MRRITMHRFLSYLALGLLFACGTPLGVCADEAQKPEEAKPTELLVTAVAVELPILKYRLHPTEPELKEGDAAPILLRLPWEQTRYFSEVVPTLDRWSKLPLDHADWKESHGVLPPRFYSEMKRAAFRRDAHWSYPIHEEPAYEILLPDVQGARAVVGNGLSAKIRYHIGQNQLDEAREGIAVGFGVSRHYAKTPFIVTHLVVSAVHRMMLDRVAELISAPNSPNLYWALSTLPRPTVDLRTAAELEARALEMTIPELGRLDQPRSRDEWRKVMERFTHILRGGAEPREADKASDEKRQAAIVRLARGELPKLSSLSPEQVAAMSDDEASIRWYLWHHHRYMDQAVALQAMRAVEALPHLVKLKAEMADFGRRSGVPASLVFDPINVYLAVSSTERRIDVLRVVEAVRHYAKKHEGRLPESLSDIDDLPIPQDLYTGQPFEWRVKDGVATLVAPAPLNVEHPMARIEYRLRIR